MNTRLRSNLLRLSFLCPFALACSVDGELLGSRAQAGDAGSHDGGTAGAVGGQAGSGLGASAGHATGGTGSATGGATSGGSGGSAASAGSSGAASGGSAGTPDEETGGAAGATGGVGGANAGTGGDAGDGGTSGAAAGAGGTGGEGGAGGAAIECPDVCTTPPVANAECPNPEVYWTCSPTGEDTEIPYLGEHCTFLGTAPTRFCCPPTIFQECLPQ